MIKSFEIEAFRPPVANRKVSGSSTLRHLLSSSEETEIHDENGLPAFGFLS